MRANDSSRCAIEFPARTRPAATTANRAITPSNIRLRVIAQSLLLQMRILKDQRARDHSNATLFQCVARLRSNQSGLTMRVLQQTRKQLRVRKKEDHCAIRNTDFTGGPAHQIKFGLGSDAEPDTVFMLRHRPGRWRYARAYQHPVQDIKSTDQVVE